MQLNKLMHFRQSLLISTIILLFTSSSLSWAQSNTDSSSKVKTNSEQTPEIHGVDVSRYQGKINFEKLKKAGIYYVFVRATVGITYQDVDFLENYKEAKQAGLKVGVYHFYETDDDPMAQLAHFKSLVKLTQGDLAPVIDIESLHKNDDKELIKSLELFLTGLESEFKIKPIVYTGKKFANRYLHHLGDYPLWLAEYEVDQPTLPSGWKNWTFWQWSQTGKVEGIDGEVDLDRFYGNREDFQSLLIK